MLNGEDPDGALDHVDQQHTIPIENRSTQSARTLPAADTSHSTLFPCDQSFGWAFDPLHCSLSIGIDLYPSVWTVALGG